MGKRKVIKEKENLVTKWGSTFNPYSAFTRKYDIPESCKSMSQSHEVGIFKRLLVCVGLIDLMSVSPKQKLKLKVK